MHFSFLSQFAIQSRKIMKRTFNLEAASLRVLSGFYRNDMALFSRHVYDRFLFDVPGYDPGEQTPLSIRSILLFTEPYVRYAIRQAANPILSQCGPVCSIQLNYTLDLYRKELPESQKQCQLLICWLNIAKENDDPVWRITLFRISDAGAVITKETPAPVMLSSARRHDLVREPRPSYSSRRHGLVRIKDENHTIHFLEKDTIIWAENNHLHSIIHTHAGTIQANTTLSNLANDALSYLYCPHKSYLINPDYLYQLDKMHLIMTDGAIIPIAERRRAQVKKDLRLAQ